MPLTYIEAIHQAQRELLAECPEVFIYGQDVGQFGGAFKATRGLSEEFAGRVIDSPISEDAMAGMVIGAAVEGARPILEMQFADFSSVAFNQIVNQAATHYYRTGVQVPLTVRLPSGGTPGSGPFHSQNMESLYAHYPGLIVVTPATVADAYGMLKEAVMMDNPVIFCEHKFLYNWLRADELKKNALPIGQARIVRQGKHVTVVTYGALVHEAVKAAEMLAADGWEIEVVDLRTVKPVDIDTIMASVSRTGRLLALGESYPWGGVTAEIVSQVVTEGFHLLDAPPMRLNSKDTPVPYHPDLWAAHRPTPESIVVALKHLLRL